MANPLYRPRAVSKPRPPSAPGQRGDSSVRSILSGRRPSAPVRHVSGKGAGPTRVTGGNVVRAPVTPQAARPSAPPAAPKQTAMVSPHARLADVEYTPQSLTTFRRRAPAVDTTGGGVGTITGGRPGLGAYLQTNAGRYQQMAEALGQEGNEELMRVVGGYDPETGEWGAPGVGELRDVAKQLTPGLSGGEAALEAALLGRLRDPVSFLRSPELRAQNVEEQRRRAALAAPPAPVEPEKVRRKPTVIDIRGRRS